MTPERPATIDVDARRRSCYRKAMTWIEAALNGPWGRRRQPRIPVAVDEIVAEGVAAIDAGAAIVHVHAYDPQSGQQNDSWEAYARIIEGIQAQRDAIVYPTIPLSGSSYASGNAGGRFAHTAELARRGLLEWTVVDPGSVNFLRLSETADPSAGFVYENPLGEIREGLHLASTHALHPSYAIYEPGFIRLGGAMAAAAAPMPTPIYRFMFSDEFAWGFPPRARYLDAYLALLEETAPGAPWMAGGLGVDVRPLAAELVRRGGHIRVGLEDAPWGSEISNAEWVASAARLIRGAGGEPAGPGDVRAQLRSHAARSNL